MHFYVLRRALHVILRGKVTTFDVLEATFVAIYDVPAHSVSDYEVKLKVLGHLVAICGARCVRLGSSILIYVKMEPTRSPGCHNVCIFTCSRQPHISDYQVKLKILRLGKQIFSHLTWLGKSTFMHIYVSSGLLALCCVYWESRICRYIRSTRASLLISGLAWVTWEVNFYACIRESRPLGLFLGVLRSQLLCIYTWV